MKITFLNSTVKKLRIIFICALLTALPCAFANGIDGINSSAALVSDQSDELNSLGAPATDYNFLSPSDPGFFDLGLTPGAFLMTGNTYFNFTGDARYLFLQLNGPPASGSSASISPA